MFSNSEITSSKLPRTGLCRPGPLIRNIFAHSYPMTTVPWVPTTRGALLTFIIFFLEVSTRGPHCTDKGYSKRPRITLDVPRSQDQKFLCTKILRPINRLPEDGRLFSTNFLFFGDTHEGQSLYEPVKWNALLFQANALAKLVTLQALIKIRFSKRQTSECMGAWTILPVPKFLEC